MKSPLCFWASSSGLRKRSRCEDMVCEVIKWGGGEQCRKRRASLQLGRPHAGENGATYMSQRSHPKEPGHREAAEAVRDAVLVAIAAALCPFTRSQPTRIKRFDAAPARRSACCRQKCSRSSCASVRSAKVGLGVGLRSYELASGRFDQVVTFDRQKRCQPRPAKQCCARAR